MPAVGAHHPASGHDRSKVSSDSRHRSDHEYRVMVFHEGSRYLAVTCVLKLCPSGVKFATSGACRCHASGTANAQAMCLI